MRYLLDSNAWIAYLRGRNPLVTQRIQQQAADIALCSVVLGELFYGAYHSGPANQSANLALIGQLRARFSSVPFDDQAAEHYGLVREHLASLGAPIGPNDLMIAACALARGLKVVTHNTTEFSRVPGLALEDWHVP